MADISPDMPLRYSPNRLLDAIIEKLDLRNDAALSRVLAVEAPVISKVRHGKLPVGGVLLIRMHEATQLSIRELRDIMGDRRDKFRLIPQTKETKRRNANPEGR
jgi:hypothetical protein